MMTTVVLIAAGVFAGALNALAGGGTFVAFPAFALAGLPPTMANASTTVALLPGTLTSAWAYRHEAQPLGVASTRSLLLLSLLGGLVGALLLLNTPERLFGALIPWLLLLATVVLAAGPRFSAALRKLGLRFGDRFAMAMQLLLGVYGGYFGGAVGLMMLAAWSLVSTADLRELAPLRSIMVSAANGMAVVCFVATGSISWPEVLMVMIGSVIGGYLGAQVGRRVPIAVLRIVTLVIAVATTATFFVRAYL